MSEKKIHFRLNRKNFSACGIPAPKKAAYDARNCNCLRCMKTEAYRVYMGKEKR